MKPIQYNRNGVRSEWYSRGYLPHRDRVGLIQSITYRLADSLPERVLEQLEIKLMAIPEDKRSLHQRLMIEDYLDSGRGCCALAHPQLATVVQDTFIKFDITKYRLIAWCIMPNHVHILIEPLIEVGRIVQSWKSYTGRWGLSHNAELGLGVPGDRLWMREYWDRYIRDEKHLRDVITYIHNNPVKAGLCAKPEEWIFSSAHSSGSM